MFTGQTLKVYNILFTFTTAIKCVPFGWNGKNSVIKMFPLRGRARWLAYLNCFVDDVATIMTTVGLGQFILANYQIKLTRIIPGLMYIAVINWISCLKYSTYIYERELMVSCNKNFQTSTFIARYYGINPKACHEKPDKILYVSAQGFMILTATIPIGAFLYQIPDPVNLYRFYFGPNLSGQLAYCFFSMVLLYNKIFILNFMTILMFGPVIINIYWIKRTMGEVIKSEKPLEQTQTTYNALQLYAQTYWHAFCPVILPLYLFGCSILCVVGTSMLILFSDQLSLIIINIIANIVFFVVFGFMLGLNLQIQGILLSEDLLHMMNLKCDTRYLELVNNYQTPIQGHFGDFFKTTRSIILITFGMIAENIASIVIGWRAEG